MLNVRDLRVVYGEAILGLKRVSLTVEEGQLVTLLGSNGAGKTTLLRALSMTLKFSRGRVASGSIDIRGKSLSGSDPRVAIAAGITQVPEGRRVFTQLTVEENLRAGGFAARSSAARRLAYERVFTLFPRLAEKRTMRAGLLSGGEQQMVAIGRALMGGPSLLLLDEPSLGLSPQMVSRLAQVIKSVNDDGTTILLVEQNAGMALRIADFAYVLDMGEIALSGRASDLVESSAVQARYLGGPEHPRRSYGRTPEDAERAVPSLSRWAGR